MSRSSSVDFDGLELFIDGSSPGPETNNYFPFAKSDPGNNGFLRERLTGNRISKELSEISR
jgi:hypothetical protein